MGSYFRDFYSPTATQRPTVGDTKFSVVNQDHMGWLKCDGRQLPTAQYNVLFQVLGYRFGGSGANFNLPDAEGRVAGAVGQSVGATWAVGDLSGQETHQLTIAEIPSHNHGTDASNDISGNNLTGVAGLHTHSITDPSHAHAITDPGHAHSYVNQPNTHEVAVSATTTVSADNVDVNQTTGSSTTGITVNTNTTGITVDLSGNHQHSIATQGGDQPHNNIQPTIFIGNMFVFSGKVRPTASNYYPYVSGGGIF